MAKNSFSPSIQKQVAPQFSFGFKSLTLLISSKIFPLFKLIIKISERSPIPSKPPIINPIPLELIFWKATA